MNIHDKIEALHGAAALRKSALNIRGGAEAFQWAMAGRNYGKVVEIGTYKGCAAAEMSQYCSSVITIDLKHGKLEHNGEVWDHQAFWESLGVFNVKLMLVSDDREKAELLQSLAFDFAFIDGAHDQTVANDFALVKRCGNVLFHDADDNRIQPGRKHKPNYVFDFIKTLPADQVKFHDIFALWTA